MYVVCVQKFIIYEAIKQFPQCTRAVRSHFYCLCATKYSEAEAYIILTNK